VRHRGHFQNEQAALKVLYLVATRRQPTRENMTGKIHGWKSILKRSASTTATGSGEPEANLPPRSELDRPEMSWQDRYDISVAAERKRLRDSLPSWSDLLVMLVCGAVAYAVVEVLWGLVT
jgi:hypothetical protein